MFTGIIESTGVIEALERKPNLCTITLKPGEPISGVRLGDSIAINGVCLTVSKIKKGLLCFDLMKETLDKTTLGALKPGGRVNLERAMAVGDRLGGHFVTGHVDGLGRITRIVSDQNYVEFQIEFPGELRKFIAEKGSICVDGISLTVGAVRKNNFSVYLIPFTMDVTTMAEKKSGNLVNIEVDILARYILGAERERND